MYQNTTVRESADTGTLTLLGLGLKVSDWVVNFHWTCKERHGSPCSSDTLLLLITYVFTLWVVCYTHAL